MKENKPEKPTEGLNVPAPIEQEKPSDVMIVSDGELPAGGSAQVVESANTVPPASTPPVMEFDASDDESMRGGYAHVKNAMPYDRKLIWTIVAVMTALCIVVAVCTSMLAAYFMRRGESPAVIKTDGKVQQNIAAVVSARKKTVVEVACGNSLETMYGSGIILKRDAGVIYILTNAHVLEYFKTARYKPSVRFYGEDAFYQAEVYGYNRQYDVAVITVTHNTLYAVDDLDGSEYFSPDVVYNEGDHLVSIGNAMGYGIACYGGTVSRAYELLECDEVLVDPGKVKNKKTVPVLRTTAVINAGMSGGAVFDMQGRLVGMGTYRLSNSVAVDQDGKAETDVEDTGFAVPVSVLYPVYNAIIKFGGDGDEVGMINIDYSRSNESSVGRLLLTAYGYICEFRNGKLTVTSLDQGTPDNRVFVGDVITKINGVEVTPDICRTAGMLLRYDSRGSGDVLRLTVSHNGATNTLSYDKFKYVG